MAAGANYIFSEVFSQDPLKNISAVQRHRGGSCGNPPAYQANLQCFYSCTTKIYVQGHKETMNVVARKDSADFSSVYKPLRKRARK